MITNNNPNVPSGVLPVESFSNISTFLTSNKVLPPNHTSYDNNHDSQKSLPSLSPTLEDFDNDEISLRTCILTLQSEYGNRKKRLNIKMARWILTDLTKAKERYHLFPKRSKFKQMVDRCNHQKFYKTEE